MPDASVTIVGGGPAGSSAAIGAALQGADVTLYEKSRFPRHKVCGEFLSPGVAPLLRELKAWDLFERREPAVIRRYMLVLGARTIHSPLEEPAFGLSRYELDQLLLERAAGAGARVVRSPGPGGEGPLVLAHGRSATARPSARGRRLFGFKAHFTGPSNDAIELHFARDAYIGVSAIEHGVTNVCGLAAEHLLSRYGFDFDEVTHALPSLRERLGPLTRSMPWLATGPLVFRSRLRETVSERTYLAGDALLFVDPFTGSGMLNALMTGSLAGRSAAEGVDAREYVRLCRARLAKPVWAASLCRFIVRSGWAERLAGLAPPELLFRMTRLA